MNENLKAPWTSARCNRLLRPLSSKIALLRKATYSEPRHDEDDSGITPSSSCSQNSNPATKLDIEWEISPRPWKRIKRTYSSRAKGLSYREFVVHDDIRVLEEAGNAVIRLPIHLTAGQPVGNGEAMAGKDGQLGLSAQRAPSRAARGISKNGQVIHGSQILGSSGSTGSSSWRLIEGICKALEALLRATTCEKTNNNAGCRSLYSICLRQTPSYITEEQRLTDDEDPENDIDVASEVYTGLEALGSVPGGGWVFLRDVVRAHGINLVGEAIQEGLIETPLSRHILSLCLGFAAYDEAECVIKSMIALVKSRSLPPKKSTVFCGLSHPVNKWATSHRLHATSLTDEASRVVGALEYYVSQTGRHGFMYRQTAVMLDDGILPVDWISSKAMIEGWNDVIRSITQEDDHAQSAAVLLRTAISMLYRQGVSNAKTSPQVHDLRLRACGPTTLRPTLRSHKPSQAVETVVASQPIRSGEGGDEDNTLHSTLFHILTVLSAINILRSPKAAQDSSRPDLLSAAILQDMALEIRRVLELATVNSSANITWTLSAGSLRLPLLAAGLVSVASRKAGSEMSTNEMHDLATLASLPSSKELLSDAGSFLGEVARCCDQAGSGDGFCFIQVMVQDLISIATSNIHEKPTRKLCSNIAHAAAFAFSEDTGQPKHLDWALEMEGTITRTVGESPKFVVDKTPLRAVVQIKSGYKWEEGICEWIAKTPPLALERPTAIEDVYHDSTNGEAPKLTLVQAVPLPTEISPCNRDRLLSRPNRRRGGREPSCDRGETRNVRACCGNPFGKGFFIRVSPRPQKVSRPQYLLKVNVADELDELSTPESSQENSIALREIPNLLLGVKRTDSGLGRNNKVIGGYDLDTPPTKRHCPNLKAYDLASDDELGFS